MTQPSVRPWKFTERPALRLRCPDQPGEAARFTRALASSDVNVQALLPVSISHGEAVLAVCVDKMEEATTALGDQIVT